MRKFARVLSSSFALLCLVCTIPVTADEQVQDKRPISVDDLTRFQSVGSPAFSPDGQWIAYTVNSSDYDKNSSTTRIWMIPSSGGEARPMTSASVSSRQPVFSKDGSKLYFVSAREEQKSQLWSLDLEAGGEARQMTGLERGVGRINFSSDQDKLLLVLPDEDTSEPLVEGSKPWVVDRLTFKRDYSGYVNHLRNHIYIYHLGSKELEQITSGEFDDSQPAWSPDDRHIAFTSNRNPEPNAENDIWLVEARPGSEPRRLTENAAADSSPAWHPDGKWLAYLSQVEGIEPNYAVSHLTRIGIDGSGAERMSKDMDRNVRNLQFAGDGDHVYFLIEDSGEQHAARVAWAGGEVERLFSKKAIVNNLAVSKAGQVAGVVSALRRPGELFVLRNGEPALLTEVNGELLSHLSLGHTEEIHFNAPDGWPIEAFVTFPPDFEKGRRYPTLLQIHGGPVSQYGHGFSAGTQLYAAHGYVVVRSNPRGSSGYGQEFTLGLYKGWGEADYQDVLAAVDHAIEQGYADPDRLGVGGYSYGGILTNYLLGQTQRFKAAASGAGSGHYLASYGHDEYRKWYETELGLPWENRELWERLSPFNYIHKATTPTLFYGGNEDWNVPIQGSEQLYQVMKRVGIETQLVVYPGEHHGGWSFANEKDSWLRRLAWYDRFLKPAE